MTKALPNTKKGFTLIELIVYFSMLGLLTGVVINSIFSLFTSYGQIKAVQNMETTAINVLDKITRDIHAATSVNVAQSSFGVPEGQLTLSVPNTSGGTDVMKYYASSSEVRVDKNGAFIGDLSLSSVRVNSFIIRQITSTTSDAFKIELGLESDIRNASTTLNRNFYTTVQMRED